MYAKQKPYRSERWLRAVACRVDGCCNVNIHGHGLCSKHYTRLRRYGSVTAGTVRGNDRERIQANTTVDANGCWVWNKSKWNGYGKTVLNGKAAQAHRFAWIVLVGEIPNGLQVNHKCHNRACVNPEHLYIGTQVENMRDMDEAGRAVKLKGEDSPSAKLKTNDVIAIRMSTETTASLARKMRVSESLVRAIRQGKCWKHVNADIS